MWIITIRAPVGEPKEHQLHSGNNTIGRMAGNDIVILDPSASRYHAKIVYDEANNQVTVYDLDSTNGTFVNRDRLIAPFQMKAGDVIRIGQHLMELSFWEEKTITQKAIPHNTHALTRELVLESLDRHAVLLAEVSSRLNTVLDLTTALSEVSSLMKESMAADRCEVLLPEQFSQLTELGFATSIARQALEQR
jgi:predicted component of type VI protein secretion system